MQSFKLLVRTTLLITTVLLLSIGYQSRVHADLIAYEFSGTASGTLDLGSGTISFSNAAVTVTGELTSDVDLKPETNQGLFAATSVYTIDGVGSFQTDPGGDYYTQFGAVAGTIDRVGMVTADALKGFAPDFVGFPITTDPNVPYVIGPNPPMNNPLNAALPFVLSNSFGHILTLTGVNFPTFEISPAAPVESAEVTVDPGGYPGSYFVSGGTGAQIGPVTVTLAPGTGHVITIGSTQIFFDMLADGTVSSTNTDSIDIDNTTGPNSIITLKNSDVTVDPGGYTNSYALLAFHQGIFTGTLVPGVSGYIITIRSTQIFFDVLADGTVTSTNMDSIDIDNTTGPNPVITFKNSDVTVDPGGYTNSYALFTFHNGIATGTLVPGVSGYIITIRSTQIFFDVLADGTVTSTNMDSIDIDNTTGPNPVITFKNSDVTVDPGGFLGTYNLFTFHNGIATGTLVPGVSGYIITIGSTQIFFGLLADGTVASANTASIEIDNVSGVNPTINFRNAEVDIDPGTYLSTYSVLGVAIYSSGPSTTTLVPGVIYRLTKEEAPISFGPFEVFHPCAVNTGNSINQELMVLPDDDGDDIAGPDDTSFTIMCMPIELDSDGDGIPDENDNCPSVPNGGPGGQVDQDVDGIGDVCDSDLDGDGVDNDVDNCPGFANDDQADLDGDAIGDVCDSDTDGDSVEDAADNCPLTPNTAQGDSDSDGLGDECDIDDDNDTIPDSSDNCPVIANSDQLDLDGNGIGDACDTDVDGDGVLNEVDQCPATPLGMAVTVEGCSGAQHLELTCNRDDFPNHGGYVSCVAHTAKDLVTQGVIDKKEKARFVKEAAKK